MERDLMFSFVCKRNLSFKSRLFDLSRYAEELGGLRGCNELALSVKRLPTRLSPLRVCEVMRLFSPSSGNPVLCSVERKD